MEHKHKKGVALPTDIRLENGSLYLPLEMKCSSTSTINIIPADWTADMLSQLISINAANQIFHLVHPDPPLVRWMIETSLEYLNIKGFHYDPNDSQGGKSVPVRSLQAGMDEKLERYRSYITHEARFISRNLETTLGFRYVKPPQITAELLRRLLDYAVSVDWCR